MNVNIVEGIWKHFWKQKEKIKKLKENKKNQTQPKNKMKKAS